MLNGKSGNKLTKTYVFDRIYNEIGKTNQNFYLKNGFAVLEEQIKTKNEIIENKLMKKTRNSEIERAYRKCKFQKEILYTCKQIKNIVNSEYSIVESILPSDYCYNIINKDIVDDFEQRGHFFIHHERNKYEYIGENANYTGNITHKGICVGQWKNGSIISLNKIVICTMNNRLKR